MTEVRVTRTYLEMASPDDLKPAKVADERVQIAPVPDPSPSLYRYFYEAVGRAYRWIDRVGWSDEEIRVHLAKPGVSLWTLIYDGRLAGYFELAKGEDGSVEIAYIGLLGAFIGRGLGGHLVTAAVERAWEIGATRVWLHTCTLDHPAALPNYLRRGFRPFKEETYTALLPDERPAPPSGRAGATG